MLTKPALRYTGGGHGGSLPDVPARDLSADEVERFGGTDALLASGLYVTGSEDKRAAGPSENKAPNPTTVDAHEPDADAGSPAKE